LFILFIGVWLIDSAVHPGGAFFKIKRKYMTGYGACPGTLDIFEDKLRGINSFEPWTALNRASRVNKTICIRPHIVEVTPKRS